jgi:hypothetical protein
MKLFLALLMAAILIIGLSLGSRPVLAQSDPVGPNFGAYRFNDGKVYKEDEELKVQVHLIPEEFGTGLDAWTVLGKSVSETVAQSDTGVWFFGLETDLFIPLESEFEFQDLIWSPGRDRFVLVRGSGVRTDMFFQLYTLFDYSLEFTEPYNLSRQTEIPGIRGSLFWLADGKRIVLTKIDDEPTESEKISVPEVPKRLRLSAVIYDSAGGKISVLKQSTSTQNFLVSSVSADNQKIFILEQYVEAPMDWADANKIQEREETVRVPVYK